MSDSNNVTLKGNLSRPPSCRYTGDGKAIWEGCIAYDKSRKLDTGEWEKLKTYFFDFATFDCDLSDFNKGDRVHLIGELRKDEWEDKETGKKRSAIKIIAKSVQLLRRKGEGYSQPRDAWDEIGDLSDLPALTPGD